MSKRGKRAVPVSLATPPSRRTRRTRRPGTAVAFLALVALGSVALLGYAITSYYGDRDWHTVASVNGASISRAQLRDRVAVVRALQHLALERTAGADPGQITALQRDFGGDPVEIARAQLIDEVLLAAEAHRRGLSLARPDLAAELAEVINGRASRDVRWVRLVVGDHSGAETDAATTALGDALAAGSTLDALRAAVDGSWGAEAHDTWLASSGPEPEGIDQPPAFVTVAARSVTSASVLSSADDGLGHLIVAAVVAIKPGPTIGQALADEAHSQGASDEALASWASGAVLRRTIAEALLAEWKRSGADQVRLAELVLGPVSAGPPSVELSGLVLTRLDAQDPTGKGGQLLAELAGLPIAARADRFATYVATANAGAPATPLEHSGEIGWFPKDGLISDLGDAAFATGRAAGDVLGPVTTSVGPELFLLEAQYGQTLDERAAAIAVEARAPGADLAAIANRVVPGDMARATGGPWRAAAEFDAAARARAGLDASTVGDLLGPIDIEGQVVVARLLERRTGPLTDESLARLELAGLGHWLADELASAVITTDPDPLGLGSPTPASSAGTGEPPATAEPIEIANPTGGLPYATPFLPTLPLP